MNREPVGNSPSPPPMSAEMAALAKDLASESAGSPDLFSLPNDAARAQFNRSNERWNKDLPEMAVARTVHLEEHATRDHGPINLRVPHSARPGVIVYFHGGGWMFGSPQTHERAIRCLAAACKMAVAAPVYRLAPEAPFPFGLDDCESAFQAIAASWETLGLEKGPIGIAGDSAGANLALATTLRAQQASTALPDFGLLFYGVFDCDFSTPSYRMSDPAYGLTSARMRAYWDRYAPDHTVRNNPLVAPLKASDALLASLPPLYLNAAEIDPLRDDTVRLSARLEGIRDVDRTVVHPGVVHGFMQMTLSLREAREAFGLAGDWVGSIIHSHNQGRIM